MPVTTSQPMSPWQEQLKVAASALVNVSDADLMYYCGQITEDDDVRLRTGLTNRTQKRKNVILVLATTGGIPESAYRMTRALQRNYANGELTVLIDWRCKSAGTLSFR